MVSAVTGEAPVDPSIDVLWNSEQAQRTAGGGGAGGGGTGGRPVIAGTRSPPAAAARCVREHSRAP